MCRSRTFAAACALGKHSIYVFGGSENAANSTINNTIEKYDIKIQRWTMIKMRMELCLSQCLAVEVSRTEIAIIGGIPKDH